MMKNEEDKRDELLEELTESFMKGCLGAVVAFVVLLAIVLLFGSCKSVEYVPVVTYHTDTCYITKQQRDSIWLHDSIHVKEEVKGDTVRMLVDRWHTKYVEKQVHDTTYIAKTDTVPQPYPVEVKVEKELNWWQRFRLTAGTIALLALLVFLGFKIYKLVKFMRF